MNIIRLTKKTSEGLNETFFNWLKTDILKINHEIIKNLHGSDSPNHRFVKSYN